jgi:CBS domain containing-hemolysin-like protein
MPDSDPPSSNEPSTTRNLPVPVARPSQSAPESGDNWLTRALRTIFRWKSSTLRADLRDVLEDGAGESGFSPIERAMLKNILALRERRVADVMVPRADIIGVQRDIALGELMKVFESAGHSRLVVYEETLDDAIGMVHIRDLVAFMTAQKTASRRPRSQSGRSVDASVDSKNRARDSLRAALHAGP